MNLTPSHSCFRLPIKNPPLLPIQLSRFREDISRLSTTQIKAVYELATLLTCGEESAALVFSKHADAAENAMTSKALASIADDELRHENLLQSVRSVIEINWTDLVDKNSLVKTRQRRFFLQLETQNETIHLARVASLDSCVTSILSALIQSDILKKSYDIRKLLLEIRQDESRHVRITRSMVLAQTHGRDIFEAEKVSVRSLFKGLLQEQQQSLEILGVPWSRIERNMLEATCE